MAGGSAQADDLARADTCAANAEARAEPHAVALTVHDGAEPTELITTDSPPTPVVPVTEPEVEAPPGRPMSSPCSCNRINKVSVLL